MRVIKVLLRTLAVLICGAFGVLMGLIFMTGLDLSIPVNMVFFFAYNGLIVIGTVVTIALVWSGKIK
ncbi:MAG: hypothetical protein KY445_13740 [Armatimonadetes bacterium]|nr:hypothetical protein [Armatimonadota bacterium]